MKEILFRGKRIDNGEWVEGYYLVAAGMAFISAFAIRNPIHVDSETVGQYTGLTDKTGKRIFEGDILEGAGFDDEDGYGVVEWFDGAFEVTNGAWCGTFHSNYNGFEFEVIGNIHDNPDLVKEEPT